MSLLQQWTALAENIANQPQEQNFWKEYFAAEKENYALILSQPEKTFAGTVAELAEVFQMEPVYFAGFLDGINASLKTPLELDNLAGDNEVSLPIDYEKLYFNMLDAKADWLYNLPQWESVLPQGVRKQITKEYRTSKMAVSTKVGRNEPCPCGSGLKYKKCCSA